MKKMIAILLALSLLILSAAVAECYVEGSGGSSNLRLGPGLSYETTGEHLEKGSSLSFAGEIETDDRGVDWYSVWFDDTYCWVSSKYTTLHVEEPEEPTEGAPILSDDRVADEERVTDFAGAYEGDAYDIDLSVYTDPTDNEIGRITVTRRDTDETVCEDAAVYGLLTNWYGAGDCHLDFTVFTANGEPRLELAIDDEVVDTLTRTITYFS